MLRSCLSAFMFLLCLTVTTPVWAQSADGEIPLGQRLEEYGKLQQQLVPLFQDKQYDKAADVCRRQMMLVPESAEPHYNLACALARLGQKDAAYIELNHAIELGFTDTSHMREDEDLASLRDDQKFKDLLKSARDKELNAPHENPAEIEGVKTIENFPEGGLRYRLRIDPKADAKNPAKLLVWLHPSGASMDDVVEEMSPKFAKEGYALLVFTQKDYRFWKDDDIAALVDKTLPDVAKIPGIDAKKPVLMGFSAGGQVALGLWAEHPENFGGLVLDAAYPLDGKSLLEGKVEPMKLPKNDAIKSCPILAVVGGDDKGVALWREVDREWHKAQIPLSLHVIPDRHHEWLFDGTEADSLHDWLKAVANGEMPSEAPPAHPHDDSQPPVKVIYHP